MWNLQNGTDEAIRRAGIELPTPRTDRRVGGKGRGGGVNRGSSTARYTKPRYKQRASGRFPDAKASLVLCGGRRGGMERGGRLRRQWGVRMLTAGSCCTADSDSPVQQLYSKKE